MKAVSDLVHNAPFVTDLGISLESIESGAVTTTMPVSTRHLQQDGFIHAAVQAAMADHTAGAAATTLLGEDEAVLTIEYKINLLRPAVGQRVRCRSTVLRKGRTVCVAESEVWTIGSGDREILTAKAQVTLAVIKRQEATREEDTETVSTQEGYDRWSEIYDREDNALVALEEPLVDALLGPVQGLRVADIGCGTGRHAIRLVEQGAHVVGVDFSPGMLSRAEEKSRILSSSGSVRFVVHDIREPLPLASQSFDRVLCALVLDHISAPEVMFAELKRICRKDGVIVATVMHPAMMLRGVQARFSDPNSGKKIHVHSAPNQIGDYVRAIGRAGLEIDRFDEHVVDEALAQRSPRARKYLHWPMLVTMRLLPRS